MKETYECMFCGAEIKELEERFKVDKDDPSKSMWDGGTVEKIYMPYGSKHDGSTFIIGICDNCIDQHRDRIVYFGNYFHEERDKVMEEIYKEDGFKIWDH